MMRQSNTYFSNASARSTWLVIQIASNLYPPTSIANIFGHWLDGISNSFKTLIRVGAYALLWSLWLCRNDLIFNEKNASPLQVIFRCTHLLRTGLRYNRRSTNRCSRQCVRGWSRRLWRFFPNMGGSITSGSIHRRVRHRQSVGP